ncbi:MAG: ATP-binding protein, partial [Trueperaceae bacterium]
MAVSDSGSGMTPDVVARAFEPFFTTKAQERGTGLGLSMVYGFVKQSRGHVKIYSEPGEGTTVRLYLPRAGHAAAEPATNAPAHDATDDAGTTDHAGTTIVLVEDDALVRELVAMQLRSLGYLV